MDSSVLLAYEREMLGLYVSDHPLLGVEHVLAAAVDCPVSELAEAEDGKIVTVGGILSSVTRKVTKLGKTWATVTLEDLEGGIEVAPIVKELLRSPSLGYTPIGLVDDDPRKKNLRLHNVRVLGTTMELPKLLDAITQ